MTLYRSITPILGELILSSSIAQPITSEITLNAKFFSGSSLTYEFYYTLDDSIKVPIQTRSVLSTAKFVPPLISTTQSVSITIHVTVYNGQEGAVNASKSFTIGILNGNAVTKITSLLDITTKLVSKKEFNKAFSRLSTLITSEFYNSVVFPTNSIDIIFAMINDLSLTPVLPTYSGDHVDLIRYLRVDQLSSGKSNEYLQFLLRLAKGISSTLNTIRFLPTQSFPLPTIITYNEQIALQLLELVLKIPVTSSYQSTVLFSIFDEISKILCLTTFFGSQPVTMLNPNLNLYFSNGYLYSNNDYCIGEDCQINSVQLPSSLTQQYFDWHCNANSLYNCNGLCLSFYFVRLIQITGNSTVKLSQTSQNTLNASNQTLTGFYFNFKGTTLITEILLLQLKNPISAANIVLSDSKITVNFAVAQSQLNANGLILCMYRFEHSSDWEVESFVAIQTINTNSINCRYTHFTQYALARLNYLPIITPPTTTTPTVSTNSTTRPIVTTAEPISQAEFPIGVAIVPILLLFVILG